MAENVQITPTTMWAIHYGNGHIDKWSVRRTRRLAIEAFCDDPAMPRWDHWYRKGCRAVKVTVATPERRGHAL